MEGNNRPLALNSWVDVSGPNSYTAAIEAVDTVFASDRDAVSGHYPSLTRFITTALYDRIASQSTENYWQFYAVRGQLAWTHEDYIYGNGRPSELVNFLESVPNLTSIEIARRTLHPSMGNPRNIIDTPVLSGLDDEEALQTMVHESAPLYRIKNLNLLDTTDQHYIQVDRKQTVRQHFGGHILTIVRNSLVVHDDAKNLPEPLRIMIDDEREKARAVRRYDYDQHFDDLHSHIEPFITATDAQAPSWLQHVLTTYYAVKNEPIVAEPLTTFDD